MCHVNKSVLSFSILTNFYLTVYLNFDGTAQLKFNLIFDLNLNLY